MLQYFVFYYFGLFIKSAEFHQKLLKGFLQKIFHNFPKFFLEILTGVKHQIFYEFLLNCFMGSA